MRAHGGNERDGCLAGENHARGGDALLARIVAMAERAQDVRHVVLDKTGTITAGRPKVVEYRGLQGLPDLQCLQIVSSSRRASEHPIARAVCGAADAKYLALHPVEFFRADPGVGIDGKMDGRALFVGSPRALRDHSITLAAAESESISKLELEGCTEALLVDLEAKRALGMNAVRDALKAGSASIISLLSQCDELGGWMMTGDNPRAAAAIASRVGIAPERVIAGVKPAEKAAAILKLQANGSRVAMVGDGINDAPELVSGDLAGVCAPSGLVDWRWEKFDKISFGRSPVTRF